jgi:hypothetical protein
MSEPKPAKAKSYQLHQLLENARSEGKKLPTLMSSHIVVVSVCCCCGVVVPAALFFGQVSRFPEVGEASSPYFLSVQRSLPCRGYRAQPRDLSLGTPTNAARPEGTPDGESWT